MNLKSAEKDRTPKINAFLLYFTLGMTCLYNTAMIAGANICSVWAQRAAVIYNMILNRSLHQHSSFCCCRTSKTIHCTGRILNKEVLRQKPEVEERKHEFENKKQMWEVFRHLENTLCSLATVFYYTAHAFYILHIALIQS